MAVERRYYPRFKKTLQIIIHRPYSEGKTKTSDISLGGAAVNNAMNYYNIEESVHIELILPKGDSIFCDARVASICPAMQGAGPYKLGLQFLNMADNDKEILKNFLAYSDTINQGDMDYNE